MASNLTHIEFCEIRSSDCDGWDCNICKQIFDAIKLAEALKPSHNPQSKPCPSFNSCRNPSKNDKCFDGHPIQCFV